MLYKPNKPLFFNKRHSSPEHKHSLVPFWARNRLKNFTNYQYVTSNYTLGIKNML